MNSILQGNIGGGIKVRRYQQIASKLLKTRVMEKYEPLKFYIPETKLLTESSLYSMLHAHKMVFIKPDKGGGGSGIIRVKRTAKETYEVRFRNQRFFVKESQLWTAVRKRIFPNKAYLIQQGIDLVRVHGHPCDLRILLQKPRDRWEISGFVAKVAARGQFVTNYCKGGKPVRAVELFNYLLMGDEKAVRRLLYQLSEISLVTAKILNMRFPGLRELGIDVGLDRWGGIWILEVNTRPNFQMFRRVFGGSTYRRIVKNHRLVI